MDKLVIQSTSTADWHSLVQEAQEACHYQLCEELESYLVFLLMRFTRESSMIDVPVALEWLNAQQEITREREECLQSVGDKCLLLSGLFPGRAERMRVRISYYVRMGQSAYCTLSDLQNLSLSKLYLGLAKEFISLMEVLQATRELTGQAALSPLEAQALWFDTGSEKARAVIEEMTDASLHYLEPLNKQEH